MKRKMGDGRLKCYVDLELIKTGLSAPLPPTYHQPRTLYKRPKNLGL
jgi:hypothetical protein